MLTAETAAGAHYQKNKKRLKKKKGNYISVIFIFMPIHLHGSIRRQKKRDKLRKSHLLIVTYVIQKTTLASTSYKEFQVLRRGWSQQRRGNRKRIDSVIRCCMVSTGHFTYCGTQTLFSLHITEEPTFIHRYKEKWGSECFVWDAFMKYFLCFVCP